MFMRNDKNIRIVRLDFNLIRSFMERHDIDALVYEIRGLKIRMNNLNDCVKILHDKCNNVNSSEQKLFYEFLSSLIDKLIQHQDAKNGKRLL